MESHLPIFPILAWKMTYSSFRDHSMVTSPATTMYMCRGQLLQQPSRLVSHFSVLV